MHSLKEARYWPQLSYGLGSWTRVVAYLAPALLGAGPAALGDMGVYTIADTLRLTPTDVTLLGADIRITATPHNEPSRPHP